MNGSSNALLVIRVVRRVRTILIRRRCREEWRYGRALSGHDARKVLKDHAVSPLYRVMMNNTDITNAIVVCKAAEKSQR